jgi:hypothetical protein
MTEHLPIQDPAEFDATDYQNFERRLFGNDTKKEDLERICMTLAHLPTEASKTLLARFRQSPRSSEVSWLECAMEEQQQGLLEPVNEREERDLLALKMVQEMEDQIIDLEIEFDKADLRWRKSQIEYEAVRSLVEEGEIDEHNGIAYEQTVPLHERERVKLQENIDRLEKIRTRIQDSIQTERFKTVDPSFMRHCHFDGEE